MAKARAYSSAADFAYIEKTSAVEAEQNFTASVKEISVPQPAALAEINASVASPKTETNQTK